MSILLLSIASGVTVLIALFLGMVLPSPPTGACALPFGWVASQVLPLRGHFARFGGLPRRGWECSGFCPGVSRSLAGAIPRLFLLLPLDRSFGISQYSLRSSSQWSRCDSGSHVESSRAHPSHLTWNSVPFAVVLWARMASTSYLSPPISGCSSGPGWKPLSTGGGTQFSSSDT